jgi:hypothetical protein
MTRRRRHRPLPTLTKMQLKHLQRWQVAEKKGAPYTIQGTPWHIRFLELAAFKVVTIDAVSGSHVFWGITGLGERVLEAAEKKHARSPEWRWV